jgi:hypothetical protein
MRYQVNTEDRNDLVLLLNPTYSDGTKAVSASDVGVNDLRLHINIRDVDGSNVFCVGIEGENPGGNPFADGVVAEWNALPDFENMYNITIDEVHSNCPSYRYVNNDWYYDAYVEIISYRYANASLDTVSMVEFAVYKVDKKR